MQGVEIVLLLIATINLEYVFKNIYILYMKSQESFSFPSMLQNNDLFGYNTTFYWLYNTDVININKT